MPNAAPKLSIIFVHYSTDVIKSFIGGSCLSRLRWCMRRDNPGIELIVVNNGERDKGFAKMADIYIENRPNSLGGARNRGFAASSGEFICFIDNDVYADYPFWGECIRLLEKYPDRKLISTPVYTTCHMFPKYFKGDIDGHPLNTRAGSNCLVMKRESFLDIGFFQEPDYSESYNGHDGVEFCNRQNKKGYLVILPRYGMVRDVGIFKHPYKK